MSDADRRTNDMPDPQTSQPTTGSEQSDAMRQADTANGEGPADGADSRAPRVLLTTDGSDAALRAARGAHGIFGDRAKYFVINVGSEDLRTAAGEQMTWGVPYPMVVPMAFPAAVIAPVHGEPGHQSELPTALDRAEQEAESVTTAASLPSDAVALGATGDPVEQIRQVAKEESIDVIVVGSSSGKWWQHFFDPSVSKGVVRHADRPVLIVP